MPEARAKTSSGEIAWFDAPSERAGAKTPILFIQGLGADHAAWTAQLSHFSDRRTIAYDARGLGTSTGATPYAMRDLALDALAVLDAAGIDQADVVGLSLGGATALHLALEAAPRVRRLVIAASMDQPDARQRAQLDVYRRVYRQLSTEDFFRLAYLNLFTWRYFERKGAFEAALRYANAHHPTADAWEAQCDAVLAHDLRDRAASIAHETLLVHGLEDVTVQIDRARRLAKILPNATLVELPGVGHSVNLEGMVPFHRAVREFLDRA